LELQLLQLRTTINQRNTGHDLRIIITAFQQSKLHKMYILFAQSFDCRLVSYSSSSGNVLLLTAMKLLFCNHMHIAYL